MGDPFDCSVYYRCESQRLVGPLLCPDDAPHFNGKRCAEDQSQCCRHPCVPLCWAKGIQIPDPYNCSMYYICAEEGEPSAELYFPCRPDDVFDAAAGQCVPGTECTKSCDAEADKALDEAVRQRLEANDDSE